MTFGETKSVRRASPAITLDLQAFDYAREGGIVPAVQVGVDCCIRQAADVYLHLAFVSRLLKPVPRLTSDGHVDARDLTSGL